MSTYRTEFGESDAQEFLRTYFGSQDIRVEPVNVGEASRAYFFKTGGKEYVLRVSAHGNEAYMKDKLAYERFSSDYVPIPEVIDVGEVRDGLSFIITRRARGRALGDLGPELTDVLRPKIVRTLTAIHEIRPIGEGYGPWNLWNLNGNGQFRSWREYMTASIRYDEYPEDGAEFYDEVLQEEIRERIRGLLSYCPEDRHLLHGDFGTGNVISDGRDITAVIDWEDSVYGDPLKDIARLDFWAEGHGFADAFKEHYIREGVLPDNFDERITCYKLHCGLGALWFMAYSGQEESYRKVRGIVERIMMPRP